MIFSGAETGKTGYRGVSVKCISGRAKWLAHVSGVVDITVVQTSLDTTLGSCNVNSSPRAVITASEYGILRAWSWSGMALGQASEELTEAPAPISPDNKSKGIHSLTHPTV